MSMKRTYTETYDMNTEQGCPTLLGIHTPIGKNPTRFLEPCFRMYKKYKYVGCDVTIVNAAKLPVDPEQLGRIEGENYVDPRDTLNPILFKGVHGESLGKVLDSVYTPITTDSFRLTSLDKKTMAVELENFYYTALGDDTWRKSPVQRSLRINGLHPLTYRLATNHQILPTNDHTVPSNPDNNYEQGDATDGDDNGAFRSPSGGLKSPVVDATELYNPANDTTFRRTGTLSVFTNGVKRLGWMDTLQFVGNKHTNSTSPYGFSHALVAQLPKLFMGLLVLPPSYLCRQYLRVIIRHKFVFAQYRGIIEAGISEGYWNWKTEDLGYENQMTGNIPASDLKAELLRDAEIVDSYDEFQEVDESE